MKKKSFHPNSFASDTIDAFGAPIGGEAIVHIGLQFGSYNPPHCAHVETAKKLKEAGGLTEVWMMPIPQSPYKKDIDQVPFEEKVEMCRILAEPNSDWLKVDASCANFPPTIKGQLQQYKRTVEGLMCSNANAQFRIVAGEDFGTKYRDVVNGMAYLAMMSQALRNMSIFNFDMIKNFTDRVIRANDVFQRLDVMTAPRATLEIPAPDGKGTEEVEISSKKIREAIKSGADQVIGIPDRLMEYILRQGFYQVPQLQHH